MERQNEMKIKQNLLYCGW